MSTRHPDPAPATGDPASARGVGFVVKLRDGRTRSWGNETEVFAASAHDAAQIVAAEPLSAGPGLREHLRARVWKLPYGTVPEVHFYLAVPDGASEPAR